ncbi:hypothetical protein [Microbacterium sp. 4-7]|uniref:hypothetical protein n=1 Tax=Microbacterium sp. 4-7 TaxID=1885327 RepID=UPI001650ADAA|nr:hypothetical protein [Microbacterium sp. 4-7]MBC6496076.1 hypothetical protein [Microbacterium sp. 4-7]
MTPALAAEVLRTVQRASKHYAAPGTDADDIASDTLVMILEQEGRGTADLPSTAFLLYATRSMASKHKAPGVHHRDIKGRAMLNARIAHHEQVTGREVSARERRAIADEIRCSFPAGKRPTIGFEDRSVHHISLNAPVGDSETQRSDMMPSRRDDLAVYLCEGLAAHTISVDDARAMWEVAR